MPALRPEFGPTLPELLRPLPRAVRVALAALTVAVAAGVVLAVVRDDDHDVLVRGPLVFGLVYPDGLVRAAPRPGELLRLTSPAGAEHALAYTVRPVTLPPYRGDINGFLPLYGARVIDEMQRESSGFVLRSEGRARIGEAVGYSLQFHVRLRGRLVFGRRLLLFPGEPGARRGADVLVLAEASPVVPNVDSVGDADPLKEAVQSFYFGEEAP